MHIDPAAPRGLITRLDRCFDNELRINASCFDTTTTLLELTDESHDIVIQDDAICVGRHEIHVETWLVQVTRQTSGELFTFYYHLHDNIVRVLTLLEAFDERTLLKRLKLFSTHPADEGGTNVLGVCDAACLNLLSIHWDQAGTLLIEMAQRAHQTEP